MNRRARGGWFAVFVWLVFTAGVATGLLLRQSLEPTPAASVPVPRVQGPSSTAVVGLFSKQLDLTEAQERQLEAVFMARRQKLGTFSEDVRVRIDEQRQATFAEIKRILTPQQQRRFEALISSIHDLGRPFSPNTPSRPAR